MRSHGGYVYILTNASKRSLYIGVTANLQRRIVEHRYAPTPGSFVARYRLRYLVYFEVQPTIIEAIAREKQLKSWSRKRKERLIDWYNEDWTDLATWEGPDIAPILTYPNFERVPDREL